MDALPLAPIELVAIDPARNVRRRYRIAAVRDLFGHWLVESDWGRIGTRGQHRLRSFADEAAARRYIAALLARRGSAERRIGVAYWPVS